MQLEITIPTKEIFIASLKSLLKKIKILNERNLLVIIFFKIFLIFGIILLSYKYLPFNEGTFRANFLSESFCQKETSIQSAFATWDAQWYIEIAEKGYEGGSAAFYPLYPGLISLLKPIFGSFASGLLLSNVFYVVGFIFYYKLVRKLFNPKIAILTIIVTLLFPTSFFFHLIYTEALTFMLFILFFYFLEKNNLKKASFFSFLLPMTRAPGIFVIIPFAYYLMKRRSKTRYLILLVAPILGFLTTHGIIYIYTGELFKSFEVQKFWIGGNSIANIFKPIEWFNRNFYKIKLAFHGITDSFVDRLVFLGSMLLFGKIWKNQNKEYFLFAITAILVQALMGMFMAYSRYFLIAFPVFIEIALLFKKNRYLVCILLITFSILQIYFITEYSTGSWIA